MTIQLKLETDAWMTVNEVSWKYDCHNTCTNEVLWNSIFLSIVKIRFFYNFHRFQSFLFKSDAFAIWCNCFCFCKCKALNWLVEYSGNGRAETRSPKQKHSFQERGACEYLHSWYLSPYVCLSVFQQEPSYKVHKCLFKSPYIFLYFFSCLSVHLYG